MLLQFTTARIIKNHDNGLLQFTIGTLLQIMTTVITIYDRYYNSRQLAVITIHDRYYNLRRYYNSRQYTPPVNYTVSINVLATMNMKNCKGTEPLSTSERSFNFHAIFLVFTLTSNTVAPHIRTVAPPLGGGGGGGWRATIIAVA